MNDQEIKDLLKQSFGQASELERDLWPQMLRRMGERTTTVPWFDWALLALVVAGLLLIPGTIPILLYQL